MVTLAINYSTLLIHYIIVLQQSFSYPEVIFLYFFLCSFNALGDHAVLYHLAFFVTHPVHQGSNTVTAEHTHQIIFKRNKKLRSTGIALPACTTTELPVHTTAFMSFST